MSRAVPTVGFELPHRVAGSFGASPPFALLDWMTTTWFRFNILVSWLLLLFVVVSAPAPLGQKLGMLLVSPLAAVFFYFFWIAFLLVANFLPVVKIPVGFLKLAYLRIFSRLVVQPISVEMPVWL